MRAFGKYRLIEPIASGGMAEVWRAEAPGAEGFVKEVALKLIRGDHDARGEFVQMFIREARLASRLAHGNIVQVFDFDQVRGRYYIAMELVRGRTLREVVDRCRELGLRFGLARAVHVCAEVARALAYAHRVDHGGHPGGVVHRDVSPQNVLLSFEGEVKLTDFGIARALGSAEVTSPGTVKGKLAYMAPEQARGAAVDARADVFAVGVILWELCTGRRLFARDSDAAILAAVVAPDPISPPSAWNEAVPPELDAIVLGALERDPVQRTASADDLASSLASMRLRLATAHEDLDLRAMLAQLWPDGGTGAREAVRERTAVRAAPAEPDDAADDVPTLTAAHRPARRSRRAIAWTASTLIAAVVALALALAGPGWARLHRRAGTASGAVSRGDAAPPPLVASAPTPAAPAAPVAAVVAPAPAAAASLPAVPTPAVDRPPVAPARPAPRPAARERSVLRAAGSMRLAPAPARAAASATPEEQGYAVIAVHATPWAYVTIDGQEAGETPLETAATARPHRLHAHHPKLGDDEVVVKLAPGQRYLWKPKLSN